MHSKEIIELNNHLREELTEENKKLYENMIIYIRTTSNKSEQQTEEVLLEILEHFVQAQKDGKTASEIFGNNIKEYCDEIIHEIPGEKRNKNIKFGLFIGIQYLALISFIFGVTSFGINYFFDLGSNVLTFSVGSGLVVIGCYLLLLYLLVKIIFKMIQKTTFLNIKKWVEFLLTWLFLTAYITLFYFIPKLIPSFGTTLSIPIIALGVIGGVLYLGTIVVDRKLRFTK
ncbi:DUF1129 family protein [Ornithinibacillus halophilus]|uniref:Uncharacterized membrane-anchored protein n=1 Tax=Ornithinibacillus halophilus TaxID=930117 RepID=A0A1M5IX22_9BACI|nr:DUF1129 family protein [Ornithinibacillus halophilus]SHG32882.1 Uncharacterized membrane-anchored protein [Ornithinibacillus halophilus]